MRCNQGAFPVRRFPHAPDTALQDPFHQHRHGRVRAGGHRGRHVHHHPGEHVRDHRAGPERDRRRQRHGGGPVGGLQGHRRGGDGGGHRARRPAGLRAADGQGQRLPHHHRGLGRQDLLLHHQDRPGLRPHGTPLVQDRGAGRQAGRHQALRRLDHRRALRGVRGADAARRQARGCAERRGAARRRARGGCGHPPHARQLRFRGQQRRAGHRACRRQAGAQAGHRDFRRADAGHHGVHRHVGQAARGRDGRRRQAAQGPPRARHGLDARGGAGQGRGHGRPAQRAAHPGRRDRAAGPGRGRRRRPAHRHLLPPPLAGARRHGPHRLRRRRPDPAPARVRPRRGRPDRLLVQCLRRTDRHGAQGCAPRRGIDEDGHGRDPCRQPGPLQPHRGLGERAAGNLRVAVAAHRHPAAVGRIRRAGHAPGELGERLRPQGAARWWPAPSTPWTTSPRPRPRSARSSA